MKWTDEAEGAVSRVPFFIRKRVKKRVEEEAERQGSSLVTLDHVTDLPAALPPEHGSEVKGFQVEACFGPTGCPNAVVVSPDLVRKLEDNLESAEPEGFPEGEGPGSPEAAPRIPRFPVHLPQRLLPAPDRGFRDHRGLAPRSQRRTLHAVAGPVWRPARRRPSPWTEFPDRPVIDFDRCLACGQCLKVCPTGTLAEGEKGYRILLGGKLGRHPQLGRELAGIHSEEDLLAVLDRVLDHYQEYNIKGERLGEVLKRHPLDVLDSFVVSHA